MSGASEKEWETTRQKKLKDSGEEKEQGSERGKRRITRLESWVHCDELKQSYKAPPETKNVGGLKKIEKGNSF